jgi:predicted transcriptional regulator
MKTRINSNSLEAFSKVDLSRRQQQVFNVIKETGTITAKGIAFQLGFTINRVTGRINELMHKQLIREHSTVRDKIGSNTRVNQYCVRKDEDPINVFYESWEEKYSQLETYLKKHHPYILRQFEVLEKHEI